MKKLVAIMMFGIASAPASATLYNDTVGDPFTTAGGGILDIVSVEVTNTATDISFTFMHDGDHTNPNDWGKYMVIIDSIPGGDPAGNGWGRPISMTSGADYWLGSWVDGGGGMELYEWGGSWPFPPTEATWNASTEISIDFLSATNKVTLTASLASLGLSVGDSIMFDAFTSGGGGGDGAIDSLGNPAQQVADWGDASNAVPVKYDVVPEPAALTLLGLGSLLFIRRRR